MGQRTMWTTSRLLSVGLLLPLATGFGFVADVIEQAPTQSEQGRAILVPGSEAVISIWTEVEPDGQRVETYSVSLDGCDLVAQRPVAPTIRLKYASFDPLTSQPEVQPQLKAQADNRLFLMQFETPMIQPYRKALEAAGVSLIKFVADQAFIVETDGDSMSQAESLPFVRWVGAFHPAYKLDPDVRARLFPNTDGQAGRAAGASDESEATGDVLASGPVRQGQAGASDAVEYSIMMTRRGPVPQTAVANRVVALGGNVLQTIPQGFRIRATLTPNQLAQVLQMNEVLYVDEQGAQEDDMDIARQIGGADFLESTLGISGEGVRAEVMDGGVRATHQQFEGRVVVHAQNSGDASHGTSTFGIVFASGTGNAQATGMLPDAEAKIFCDYDLVLNQSQNRYGLTAELVDPNGPYRGVFQSNSWGNNRTRDYTTISAEMDDITFLNDLLVCQSQSNAGNPDSRPQAWSKNIVSVGGVYHRNTLSKSDDAWSRGGSTGPAADGRIKPELTHFYDSIFTTSYSSDTSYTSSFGGTSGATPIIAGHFGLMYQMWHEGVFPGFGGGNSVFEDRPGLATAKALMVNAAVPYTGGDFTRFNQGWGMPDLTYLYDNRDTMMIIDETDVLQELQSSRYQVTVGQGGAPLRITMVFRDLMGNPAGQYARINDLSLKVTDPNNVVYWGNNGLTSSNFSTSGGVANTIDTVENVFVQSPAAGTWTLEVIASEINEDAYPDTPQLDAAFALVASGIEGYSTGMRIVTSGTCPGEVTVNWSDAPQNVSLGLVFAASTGSATIPNGTCAGTVLGLSGQQIRLVTTVNSGSGSGSVAGTVNLNGVCNGYLQMIETDGCTTSNVVRVRP